MSSLVRPDLGDYMAATNLMFNEKIRQMIQDGRPVYHFGFGQAPFPVIETAVAALKEYAGRNAYLAVQGIPELRLAICDFHAKYDALHDINPDNIIVGPGSKELIFLLTTVFNGTVMLLSPSWTTYKPQTELAGKTPVILPTCMESSWRLTPELLEEAIEKHQITGNKLLIFTNPDNPTGACYSRTHLLELSKVLRKHQIIVLSDEIYARLHYDQSHVTLAQYYPEGTILSTGMSKWASAGGWRLGYHIYPPELSPLLSAVKSAASHTYSCAPAPVQYAVAKTLRDLNACDEYIRHTTRVMLEVSQFCYSELRAIGVRVETPGAGYYIFPDFDVIRPALQMRGVTTGNQMCQALLEEANVALMAGGPAYLRPTTELTTRLCYVNFDGSGALANSRKLGLETPLPDNFVQEFCTPVYDGILALKKWVLVHKNQQNALEGPPVKS